MIVMKFGGTSLAAADRILGYGDGRKIIKGRTLSARSNPAFPVACTEPTLCEYGMHGSIDIRDALAYAPGETHVKCAHCGATTEIEEDSGPWSGVVEQDLQSALANRLDEAEMEETLTIHCDACGADVEFDAETHAAACPFCASPPVSKLTSTAVSSSPSFGISGLSCFCSSFLRPPKRIKHVASRALEKC